MAGAAGLVDRAGGAALVGAARRAAGRYLEPAAPAAALAAGRADGLQYWHLRADDHALVDHRPRAKFEGAVRSAAGLPAGGLWPELLHRRPAGGRRAAADH